MTSKIASNITIYLMRLNLLNKLEMMKLDIEEALGEPWTYARGKADPTIRAIGTSTF